MAIRLFEKGFKTTVKDINDSFNVKTYYIDVNNAVAADKSNQYYKIMTDTLGHFMSIGSGHGFRFFEGCKVLVIDRDMFTKEFLSRIQSPSAVINVNDFIRPYLCSIETIKGMVMSGSISINIPFTYIGTKQEADKLARIFDDTYTAAKLRNTFVVNDVKAVNDSDITKLSELVDIASQLSDKFGSVSIESEAYTVELNLDIDFIKKIVKDFTGLKSVIKDYEEFYSSLGEDVSYLKERIKMLEAQLSELTKTSIGNRDCKDTGSDNKKEESDNSEELKSGSSKIDLNEKITGDCVKCPYHNNKLVCMFCPQALNSIFNIE